MLQMCYNWRELQPAVPPCTSRLEMPTSKSPQLNINFHFTELRYTRMHDKAKIKVSLVSIC